MGLSTRMPDRRLYDEIYQGDQRYQQAHREGDSRNNEVHGFAAAEVPDLVFPGLHAKTRCENASHHLGQGQVLTVMAGIGFLGFHLYWVLHIDFSITGKF